MIHIIHNYHTYKQKDHLIILPPDTYFDTYIHTFIPTQHHHMHPAKQSTSFLFSLSPFQNPLLLQYKHMLSPYPSSFLLPIKHPNQVPLGGTSLLSFLFTFPLLS